MHTNILGLAVLVVAVGCGGDDDGGPGDSSPDGGAGADAADQDGGTLGDGAPGDAGAGEFEVELVRPWCGPADGPAVQILLGAPAEDSCAVDELQTRVQLEVWTQDIMAGVVYSFAPGESMGAGALCPGGTAPCRSFPSGDIRFESYGEGTRATGTWRLFGEGDTMLTGSFDATWCEADPPPPCG